MTTATNLSTSERIRRAEIRRDDLGALSRGVSLEQRTKQREEFANEWAAWLRMRMDSADCDDPVALLPDAKMWGASSPDGKLTGDLVT
jgi:hypothetical protein